MGMQLGQKPAGGRRRRQAGGTMSEINVTPLVDVMLVLLIIFMITAPLLNVSVPVDLPQTRGQNIPSDKEPLVVSITRNGDIYLMQNRVELEGLVPRLTAIRGNDPEMRIFVRGDKGLAYGRIMEVMGALTSAGFKRVALVADLPKKR
jgi:biopolymer transport protein TolR